VSNNDFFEMGGDSLSAVQLVNQINATFGSSLTVTDLYKNGSAPKIVDKINSKRGYTSEINWQHEWQSNLGKINARCLTYVCS
jgi:hypothetical protein